MSFHRENVTWQAPDGRWWIGFYACEQLGYNRDGEDREPDPEWDVEYDFGKFEDVVGPGTSEEHVWTLNRGPNPGGTSIWENDPDASVRFEQMRLKWEADERAARANRPAMFRPW